MDKLSFWFQFYLVILQMMLNALLMRQMQTKRLPVQKWTSNQEINWNAFELIMKNLIKILSAKMLYRIHAMDGGELCFE